MVWIWVRNLHKSTPNVEEPFFADSFQVFVYGINGAFAPVAIAPVRALFVIVFEPLVQVFLECFDRIIKLLPKRWPEEFIQNRAVEALHKAIGLRAVDLGGAVFDIVKR